MNTCDTCKWWDLRAKDWGICTHPKLDYNTYYSDELDVARPDAEACFPVFETRSKFGCIHHESK